MSQIWKEVDTADERIPFVCGLCFEHFRCLVLFIEHFEAHQFDVRKHVENSYRIKHKKLLSSHDLQSKKSSESNICTLFCSLCEKSVLGICLLQEHIIISNKTEHFEQKVVEKERYMYKARHHDFQHPVTRQQVQPHDQSTTVILRKRKGMLNRDKRHKEAKCDHGKHEENIKETTGIQIFNVSDNNLGLEGDRDMSFNEDVQCSQAGVKNQLDEKQTPCSPSNNKDQLSNQYTECGQANFEDQLGNEQTQFLQTTMEDHLDNEHTCCRQANVEDQLGDQQSHVCNEDVRDKIHVFNHSNKRQFRQKTKNERPRLDEKIPCDVCGILFLKKNLSRHKLSHNMTKTHQCDICNKLFKTKDQLYGHKLHHNTRRDLICDYCGKAFNNGPNLRQHMKTHTGERTLKCPLCPKMFRSNYILKDHINRHSDNKPHICDRCGKSFRTGNEVSRHLRVHSDDRPYSCDLCKKSFKSRSNLKKHIKTHQL